MNTKYQYSERASHFLMMRANQWKCSPQEAEARIIEEAAKYAELRREKRREDSARYSVESDDSSAAMSSAS